MLYDAINILYGDISHIVSSFGLTSQEMKVCYLTYIGIAISEQAKVLIIETNNTKRNLDVLAICDRNLEKVESKTSYNGIMKWLKIDYRDVLVYRKV